MHKCVCVCVCVCGVCCIILLTYIATSHGMSTQLLQWVWPCHSNCDYKEQRHLRLFNDIAPSNRVAVLDVSTYLLNHVYSILVVVLLRGNYT